MLLQLLLSVAVLRTTDLADCKSTGESLSLIHIYQLKTLVAALDTCFSVLMQNDLSATEQEEFRIRCRSALDGVETLDVYTRQGLYRACRLSETECKYDRSSGQ